MASVFLSYDREDAGKARQIALALEKAGHSVWWDRHIKGGSQYGKEIEEALNRADAVVVLWSDRSVESAWVRDEAAAGRDRGCLVPVQLDTARPPMGFRQYQTIDLSSWKGRGKPPRLQEILSSIDVVDGKQTRQPFRPAGTPTIPQKPGIVRLALITALVIGAIALAYFLVQRSPRGEAHTIAVTAADPSARPLARDLLANLGGLQAAQSGSLRLISETEFKPDLIFEATSGSVPGEVGAGLILKSGKDRGILWSKDFAQASDNQADLKQRMALTSGRVLDCVIDGLDADGRALEQRTLKLYVNACAKYAEIPAADAQVVIDQFRDVVASAPGFKAAHAMLLLAESDATALAINSGRADAKALRRRLREDIRKARELDPDMAEISLAEAAILPRNGYFERLRLLDQAKNENPDNATVLESRASALMRVGRLREAIEDSKRSAELAPLSARALGSYVLTLAYAGRLDAAKAELQRAERLWPGTPVLRDVQYNFHWHFGDPMIALQLTPPGLPKGRELFLQARAEPSQANINRFLAFIRAIHIRLGRTDVSTPILQEFAAFHREDELYARILDPRSRGVRASSEAFFQPALKTFREDRRFMLVAKKAGLLQYWQKSGEWPDFCFEEELPYDCKAEAAKLPAYAGTG